MKRLVLASVSLVWLSACDAPSAFTGPALRRPPAASESSVLVNEMHQAGGTFTYTCGPVEDVVWEGIWHVLVIGEIDGNNYDITEHVNLQGAEGVGAITGDHYVIQEINHEQSSLHFDPLSRTIYTDDRYLLVRQGSEDNAWVRMTGSFSFPPVESVTIRAEVECRG